MELYSLIMWSLDFWCFYISHKEQIFLIFLCMDIFLSLQNEPSMWVTNHVFVQLLIVVVHKLVLWKILVLNGPPFTVIPYF